MRSNAFERYNKEQATKMSVTVSFLNNSVQNKIASVVESNILKPD